MEDRRDLLDLWHIHIVDSSIQLHIHGWFVEDDGERIGHLQSINHRQSRWYSSRHIDPQSRERKDCRF